MGQQHSRPVDLPIFCLTDMGVLLKGLSIVNMSVFFFLASECIFGTHFETHDIGRSQSGLVAKEEISGANVNMMASTLPCP